MTFKLNTLYVQTQIYLSTVCQNFPQKKWLEHSKLQYHSIKQS